MLSAVTPLLGTVGSTARLLPRLTVVSARRRDKTSFSKNKLDFGRVQSVHTSNVRTDMDKFQLADKYTGLEKNVW